MGATCPRTLTTNRCGETGSQIRPRRFPCPPLPLLRPRPSVMAAPTATADMHFEQVQEEYIKVRSNESSDEGQQRIARVRPDSNDRITAHRPHLPLVSLCCRRCVPVLQSLQHALDQATFDFMRTHPSLSSDQQKQLVAAWTDAQRQRPHRPAADHADAHANGDGNTSVKKKKIVRAYIGERSHSGASGRNSARESDEWRLTDLTG